MIKTEIIPIEYANSVLAENLIFKGGNCDNYLPISFKIYLIKSGKHKILIDVGCITMPGFDMKNFIGPIKALENIGLSADEITDIIITHAHHDHIECAKFFKNAKFYIQKDEYLLGKNYLTENKKITLFKNRKTIYNNIKIIKIGGHSVGSCVIEIETDNKIYVIVGDECYLRTCLTQKIPTGASYGSEENSRKFIEKYSQDKYNCLLLHDE